MATLDDVIRLVQHGARSGDAACQSMLGSFYESGIGLPQDIEQSLAWYHRAASQGDADALFALGRMTVEALGEPDGEMDEEILAHAYGLIRAAADAGNMQAHVYLSRLCDG